jgi:hypothetical protein
MEDGQVREREVEQAIEVTQPIVIDLGKQRPKLVKQLKEGRGKLWDEVADVIDEVGEQLGAEANGKTLVPIILVYRKKPRRRSINPLFPFAPR